MYYLPRLLSPRNLRLHTFLIRNVIGYPKSEHIVCPKTVKGRSFKSSCIPYSSDKASKMEDPDACKTDLKTRLTPLQYHVTQEKGTERPFTGKYNKNTDSGMYSCIVCGQYLFSSDTKYESGCGWPAFNDVLDKGLIKLSKDTSTGIVRTEVQCAKCDAHLGHVFNDGPKPTGKRFCINSASIDFHPKKDEDTK